MAKRPDWSNLLSDLFVPIHQDGHKFLAIALGVAFLGFLIWSPIGWTFTLITALLAYVFRDPERVSPVREGLIVAAADGKISAVETVAPPAELGLSQGERVRVSIYSSLFDVALNRAPVGGKVVRAIYVPGAFASPKKTEASDANERRALIIETPHGDEVAVVQVAGVLSRRILTYAGEGDVVSIGQRFGLMRFGSRIDIYLPSGQQALVAPGQTSIGGETVLCDTQSAEPARETRRD